MTLDELKETWVAEFDPEIQARLWDRVAGEYSDLPIPNMKEDPFLCHLSDYMALTADMKSLDIGCGTGSYTLALAPVIAEAHGVDISGKMIQQAVLRSKKLNYTNTFFREENWQEADIEALGYRGAFDVVFAHMTPAVADYSTLDKMNACSKALCLLEKPTRRHDRVLDAALRSVGLEDNVKFDSDILNVFTYLWHMGYKPQFFYRDEVWEVERPTEEMVSWCTDRAKLRKSLSISEEMKIRSLIENLSKNGKIAETTSTTRVTIIWSIK